MADNNKLNPKKISDKNLLQKNFFYNAENVKKEIFTIRENVAKEFSLLDKKIFDLESRISDLDSKIFDLEEDIKFMKKEFNKNKGFLIRKFNTFCIRIILFLLLITPFIISIVLSILIWLIAKFIK
ncbi:hypothetical protein [Borreliella bissettiae]|uniref:Uncharacterized protein n=1 Tax=Borrelia bissettiae (strain DSM 17990 / CIP 109136 / DN127) TaxID=521010 RepID=G0ANX3_BORBD|nr:hypothetical protein [Borreliella bissettiae]AEL19399.1 conserved hypothetical protein [Borreliella bissettiae DN127]